MELPQSVLDAVIDHLFLEVEASGRHVHLTTEAANTLFGHGLTQKRPLSQPGQFVCHERVTLEGPNGFLSNVAVLGPERDACQAEISMTDARILGINAPVRLSGNIQGTPPITIRTGRAALHLPCGAIVAQRHIHMTPEDAAKRGIKDGQKVKVRCFSQRGVTFEQVPVRVHPSFATRMHIDYDEANACGFQKGDWGLLIP